jgi:hypothetical protein
MKYVFKVVRSSTPDLMDYEYVVPTIKTIKDLKSGKKITLVNPETKKVKKFIIDYIKGRGENITLKSSHVSIVLKRII